MFYRKIKVDNKVIGDGNPVFIIAEAGINHNGRIDYARRLIEEAKKTGADAVKFQVFKAESICARSSPYYTLFKKLEFTKDEWLKILSFARKKRITFFASCFDEETVDLMDNLGVPIYKIASGDITHLPLIQYVASKKKPVILSTGTATLSEIKEALALLQKKGMKKVILMHCISNRPARMDEVNLRTIPFFKEKFNLPVGFSDHTEGVLASFVAVSLGANAIEKHFTLSNKLKGPDHKLSLEPDTFRCMVEAIRNIEKALGRYGKFIALSEKTRRIVSRRSIFAAVDIKKGERISRDKIKIVRPAEGILPKYLTRVLARRARRDIRAGEKLSWDKLR